MAMVAQKHILSNTVVWENAAAKMSAVICAFVLGQLVLGEPVVLAVAEELRVARFIAVRPVPIVMVLNQR